MNACPLYVLQHSEPYETGPNPTSIKTLPLSITVTRPVNIYFLLCPE